MAVLLGVGSGPSVVLVDEDAHFRQKLHLLLVQVICGDLRHFKGRLQVSDVTARHTDQGQVNNRRRHRSMFITVLILSAVLQQ